MSGNKDKDPCGKDKQPKCYYNKFRRPSYFHGKLLDDVDFRNEQDYHAGKRRLLNRMLHGSGVVCGLELKRAANKSIILTQGLALDCCGREIWVDADTTVDLADRLCENISKNREDCPTETDDDPKRYYIGIRYEEKPTDPVPVYLPGGGCDDRVCENSRVKEGFCIEIVDCCRKKPKEDEKCDAPIACPDCGHCDKPCFVVLGEIELDNEWNIKREVNAQGTVINDGIKYNCREYVLTGRLVQQVILKTLRTAQDAARSAGGTGSPVPPKEINLEEASTLEILCDILGKYRNVSEIPNHKAELKRQSEELKRQSEELKRQYKALDERVKKLEPTT